MSKTEIKSESILESLGINKFMDGLYVGNPNPYFDLSQASNHINSVCYLYDSRVNIELIEDSVFSNLLCMKTDFQAIYFSDFELVKSLYTKTGSLLIACRKYSYGCLYANAISSFYGRGVSMEKLKEIVPLTSVEEEIYRVTTSWKNIG